MCRPNGLVIGKIELSKPPFRWPKPRSDRTNGYWDICKKPFSLHPLIDIENQKKIEEVKQDWVCNFFHFYSCIKVKGRKVVVLEISYTLVLISSGLVPYPTNKWEGKFSKLWIFSLSDHSVWHQFGKVLMWVLQIWQKLLNRMITGWEIYEEECKFLCFYNITISISRIA